jgi:hypothetical protein
MNLPALGETDAIWFFSDWEGEQRSLTERFADLFYPHLPAGYVWA